MPPTRAQQPVEIGNLFQTRSLAERHGVTADRLSEASLHRVERPLSPQSLARGRGGVALLRWPARDGSDVRLKNSSRKFRSWPVVVSSSAETSVRHSMYSIGNPFNVAPFFCLASTRPAFASLPWSSSSISASQRAVSSSGECPVRFSVTSQVHLWDRGSGGRCVFLVQRPSNHVERVMQNVVILRGLTGR